MNKLSPLVPVALSVAPNNGSTFVKIPEIAWHLSVQKHTPELRPWQARLHQLDDAAKPSGEPGGSASGDLLWLIGGTFFARGRGVNGVPLSRGHRPVEGQGHDEDQAIEAGGGGGVGVLHAEDARVVGRGERAHSP